MNRSLQSNPTRRALLGGSTLPAWMPRVALSSGSGVQRDVLVNVYLRGGADGLTMCVPWGDPDLYVYRPTLAIQPPGSVDGALDLDGFFGLAPASAPLLPAYQAGNLAFVHASGSPDPTRSHFEAQYRMETATPNNPFAGFDSGWLGRHLANVGPMRDGTLRGMGLATRLARTLVGGPATLPVPDPGSFAFPGSPATAPAREDLIASLYGQAEEPLRSAAEDSLASIELLAGVDFAGYVPSNGAVYPLGDFGTRLRSAATLIKSEVGVEAMHIDIDGWDHHAAMGPVDGILATRLDELSRGLAAFHLDLTAELGRVVVVVQTEFGRRIRENGSLGTDHGHGGCMMVLGGNVQGGQVIANWPGIDASSGSGDMEITTDYRDVLWEILSTRLGATDLTALFPDFTPAVTPPGVIG